MYYLCLHRSFSRIAYSLCQIACVRRFLQSVCKLGIPNDSCQTYDMVSFLFGGSVHHLYPRNIRYRDNMGISPGKAERECRKSLRGFAYFGHSVSLFRIRSEFCGWIQHISSWNEAFSWKKRPLGWRSSLCRRLSNFRNEFPRRQNKIRLCVSVGNAVLKQWDDR